MDDVAAAATAPSSLCLSALRVGSLVHDVRVTLHIAEAVASSGVTSNGGGKRPQSQSSLRFQAKQRARALQRAPASPSSSSAPLLIPAASGLVRCALSDHSASVIADVPQHLIDSRWHSAVAVRVDGQISYEAGHLIFTVSSLSRASDLPSTSSSSSSSLRCVALSSLLNPRSVVSHASGVWLLRLVAGELFALLLLSPIDADAQSSPDDDEQDGSVDMQPPYQMMRAPWTDDDGGRQQCARDALHTTTSVRDDQFVLLTAVQSAPILRTSASNGQERAAVQLVLFCGIVLPGVDLSGDHVDETVLDREHWVHAARAMSELPAEWSESLTQVITSLGMWVDRWTRRMDLEATDGNAQAHASDEEEELFDHKGRVRKQIREAHDAGTNSQAQKDGDIELPALTLTQLVSGLDASSPSFAQHLVRDLNVALESCESTLQALRQQQRDKAEDEDDEEEEDEDGDAKLTQADPASTAAPPQAPQARRPRGAAPTSAAKLVSGSRAKAPAIVDDAKVRRLRASLRTVLGAIESGQRRRLPVCILTGFLGSGKTSLLNHLLGADHGLRIGVIVNDFSEVNVDAALLHAARPEHLVELSNGCICCTLRADLFTSVVELVATQKVDYICVESTGLGEPAPIAATFTFDFSDADAQGAGMQTYGLSSLAQLCQIDCIATVVDSAAVFNTINKTMQQAPCSDDNSTAMEGQHDAQAQKQHHDKRGAGSSKRHKQEKATAAARSPAAVSTSSTASAAAALSAIRASESSTKSVLSLLIDQLEYCNVLVLNKSSLLSASQLQLVEEFVRLNNVAATCVRADYGRIQPDIIIGANKFNQQESLSSPLLSFAAAEWHALLQSRRVQADSSAAALPIPSESVEYGISSFVYLRRVGFAADRLHSLLSRFQSSGPASASGAAAAPLPCMHGVVRVKGVFWIGERHQAVGVWQATTPGHSVSITASGAWLLDLSAEDCVTSGRELVSLESRWHSRVSDRYTQLVFIGAQMDEEAIRIALDDCCLTQKEMDDALREDEDDEDEEEDAVADAKQALMQAQIKRWPLLQPLLAFDTDPNAEPTCALRQ